MAIKREMNITINFKDGTTLEVTGDPAQRVYQQYKARATGGINNGLTFENADGNEQYIEFCCLCGYTLGDTTETEVPDVECDPLDCLN